MKKSNKPALRFKGFNDAWEQRKLYELGHIMTGSTPSPTHNAFYSDDGIPWVTPTDITSNLIIDTSKKLSEEGEKVGRVVPANTILVTCIASIGKNALLKVKGSFNQQINSLTPNNENDPYFLLSESELWSLKMKRQAAAATMQIVNKAEFSDIETFVPIKEEQIQIGEFFENLDSLITLHQSKYDKLKNMKRACLEKMFPKNGSNVPEIRFKGFTEAWEQRKLADYLLVSSEKNSSDRYGRADVLSVSGDFGIVNQIEFQGRSFAGASVSNYGVVQTGDVVYTKSPLNSNPYGIIKTNKGKAGIVSTLYAVYHPRETTFPDFVQVYFEQHARMNNYMHPLVNKGAKNDMKVSAENALKGLVCFPSYQEQKTISEFFSVLDHLIALHQRELEKLQNIKKSCLEKMFV